MPVIEQVKRFSALGELRYIERYSISDDGTVLRVFRYTAEGELLYSKAYVYDSSGDSGKLVRWYYFGADGLASSALAYKWEEDDSGRLLAVVSFAPVSDTDSTLESKSSVRWFYLPDSQDWNLEARRGDDPWSLGSDPPNSKYPEAGGYAEVAHTLSDEVPLDSVDDPVPVDLPVPEVLDDSLDLVNYRLAWKDTDGSSLVKVEPLPGGSIFRPVSMERTDRRLGNSTVRMNLSYDAESVRISAKETYYGTTLALRIAMTYDNDGFPTSMDTTGAALLLPLKYDITWGVDHSLDRLDLRVNGALMQYFVFDYNVGDAIDGVDDALSSLPLTLSDACTFDVFDFGNAFKTAIETAGMSIAHYDGEKTLVETFKLGVLTDDEDNNLGLKAEVWTAPTEAHPDGELKGSYRICYDNGLAVSLGAYKADGSPQWTQSYGYTESEVAGFIDSLGLPDQSDLKAFFAKVGSLYETWVPEDLKDDLDEVATGALDDPEGTVKKLEDQAVSAYASTEMGAIRMLFDFLL